MHRAGNQDTHLTHGYRTVFCGFRECDAHPLMRTDLDHLHPHKQRELERIVEVIFNEFRAATEHATGRRKGASARW